jgi:hypothetical protein
MPCQHGSAAFKEYIVTFTSHSVALPASKKHKGSWVQHVICLNGVTITVNRGRLTGSLEDVNPYNVNFTNVV